MLFRSVPASALERLILPARVADYQPAMLDELTASGEVSWTGAGALAVDDGWVSLAPTSIAPAVLPEPLPVDGFGALHQQILAELAGENALFFRGLMARLDDEPGMETGAPERVLDALWELLWAGHLTNDTLAPLRALLGAGKTAHRAKRPTPRGTYASLRLAAPLPGAEQALTTVQGARAAGRWSRVRRLTSPTPQPASASAAPVGATVRAAAQSASASAGATARAAVHAASSGLSPAQLAQLAQIQAEVLLDRYGLVTRGSVGAERGGVGALGNFSAAYRVLSAFEEVGRVRRGYFVDGLGAAQFAADGVVDRLRSEPSGFGGTKEKPATIVLAATDPANAYGASVDWPHRQSPGSTEGAVSAETAKLGHRPGRKAGALVVLHDGQLAWYVERGGRTVLTFHQDPEILELSARALADSVRSGRVGALTVAAVDGVPVLSAEGNLGAGGREAAPGPAALVKAGFSLTPQGLRLRG